MKSSPEIIAALTRLKEMSALFCGALHDQEHLWEHAEYPKLEKVWDEANREVWECLHHKFLKRIYDLGGEPAGVTLDIVQAYKKALEGFSDLHAECQKVYELVEDDDDYVTEKLLMKTQAKIECWINYFEAKLAQVAVVKVPEFMAEQMD